jgi:hypothetical protein
MDYKLDVSPIRSYRIEPILPSSQAYSRHLTFNDDSFTSDTPHSYKQNEEEIVAFGSPLAEEKTRPHTAYYSPKTLDPFAHRHHHRDGKPVGESPFAFKICNFRTYADQPSDLISSKYENKVETPNDSFEQSDYYTQDLPRLSLKDIQETEREYLPTLREPISEQKSRREVMEQDEIFVFDREEGVRGRNSYYSNREGYTDKELDEVEMEQQLRKMREDEEYLKLSFESKFFNNKWQIRKKTYEDIAECFKARRNLFISGSHPVGDVFVEFEGLLREMATDSNLVCQFEGLKSLYVYLTCVHEIKSSVIGLLDELISKCNTNKPAYNDTLSATLIEALVKEEQGMLLYKICNRLDSRNNREAIFCIKVLENAIDKIDLTETKFKLILDATSRALKHNLATVRSSAVYLARNLYQSVSLSLDEFLKSLGELKPIISKEIREACAHCDKYPKILKLADTSSYSAELERINSATSPSEMLLSDDLRPKEDVMSLISAEFFKLPYETDVKNKRKILSCVNNTVLTGTYTSQPEDYLPIVHVFFHLLEETNSLIYAEVMKLMSQLIPKIPHTFAMKGKQLVKHLVEKFKEKKQSIKIEAKKILSLIRKYEIFSHENLVEFLVEIAADHKNPQVRENSLSWIREEIESTGQAIDLLSGVVLEKPWYEDILGKIADKTSPKLLEILKKDVAGNVRDTAVALLGTFKAKLEDNGPTSALNKIIQKLPKNRINEIKKQRSKTVCPALHQTNLIELDYTTSSAKDNIVDLPDYSPLPDNISDLTFPDNPTPTLFPEKPSLPPRSLSSTLPDKPTQPSYQEKSKIPTISDRPTLPIQREKTTQPAPQKLTLYIHRDKTPEPENVAYTAREETKNVVEYNIEDLGFDFNRVLGSNRKRDPIEMYSFDESVHSKLMDYAESVCNTEISESVCENMGNSTIQDIISDKPITRAVTESILLDLEDPLKPPNPSTPKSYAIKKALSALEISSPSVTHIPTIDFFSFPPSVDLNTTSTFISESKTSSRTLSLKTMDQCSISPSSTPELHEFDASSDGILHFQFKLMYSQDPAIELSQPLKASYKTMKFVEDRKRFVHGVLYALSNEDILSSLEAPVLSAMIDAALYFCVHEKIQSESESAFLYDTMSIGQDLELSALLQKLVSVLLDSRDTSILLITLIKSLNSYLPKSFYLPLSVESLHSIKIYIKCITKLVDSISYERLKVFEIFVSLYKIFGEHPPEKLNSDCPNVQVYEYMFRVLRSISDKLISLDPNKVQSFLQFCIRSNPGSTTSIYVKYLAASLLKKYNLTV